MHSLPRPANPDHRLCAAMIVLSLRPSAIIAPARSRLPSSFQLSARGATGAVSGTQVWRSPDNLFRLGHATWWASPERGGEYSKLCAAVVLSARDSAAAIRYRSVPPKRRQRGTTRVEAFLNRRRPPGESPPPTIVGISAANGPGWSAQLAGTRPGHGRVSESV